MVLPQTHHHTRALYRLLYGANVRPSTVVLLQQLQSYCSSLQHLMR